MMRVGYASGPLRGLPVGLSAHIGHVHVLVGQPC